MTGDDRASAGYKRDLEFEVEVPLRALFDGPTIGALAAAIMDAELTEQQPGSLR